MADNSLKLVFESIPLYMWIILGVSVLMTVAGFFIPPVGIIDGSAITGTGVLFGGTTLFYAITHISEWMSLYKEIKGIKTAQKTTKKKDQE